MSGYPDEYVAASIRDALARDPRGAELGIDVSVSDDAVLLTGRVATAERKLSLEEIVREHAPDRSVRNEILVIDHPAATSMEELS
jgi:osmotically-inducible protein OsmY